MRSSGFTLVEIMIVVAIIGLLATIAIPSFVKARDSSRQTGCINNLRQIDAGKDQWAIAASIAEGAACVESSVNEYIKGGAPTCPGGGTYTYGNIGSNPTCTASGHEL